LNTLSSNVFGTRELKLEVTLNGEPYRTNWSSNNINIALPIFTIHGNHDYPANEFGKISVCDLLQASNYVNYFGKHLNLHSILIRPLIITKPGAKTKIALYGLGYIKDPILNDLFEEGKASFEKPMGDLSEYVTIFILHQNRYKKKFRPGVALVSSFSPKNIPEWINLTIWGHEHEAIYRVESEFDRPIYQPGSTVLTSCNEGEIPKKQCVLIKVKGTSFSIDSILL
jgi:double-strand break repair protein MRE11